MPNRINQLPWFEEVRELEREAPSSTRVGYLQPTGFRVKDISGQPPVKKLGPIAGVLCVKCKAEGVQKQAYCRFKTVPFCSKHYKENLKDRHILLDLKRKAQLKERETK